MGMRVLEDEVFVMEEIQTESRKTVCNKRSGYTGLSELHELHPLYGFDVIKVRCKEHRNQFKVTPSILT